MSLPGSFHSFDKNEYCDRHPKTKAVAKMQGETDSFGAEYIYMCQKCLDNHKKYLCSEERVQNETKSCDWCKEIHRCFPTRDYDEGMNGPVYYVCENCLSKQDQAINEELSSYDDYYDDPYEDHRFDDYREEEFYE